jgi:hypothetical protein
VTEDPSLDSPPIALMIFSPKSPCRPTSKPRRHGCLCLRNPRQHTKEARELEMRSGGGFRLVGRDRSDACCECGYEFRY